MGIGVKEISEKFGRKSNRCFVAAAAFYIVAASCGQKPNTKRPAQVSKATVDALNSCGLQKSVKVKFELSTPAYADLFRLGENFAVFSEKLNEIGVSFSNGVTVFIPLNGIPKSLPSLQAEAQVDGPEKANYFRAASETAWKWDESGLQFGSLRENQTEGFDFVKIDQPSLRRSKEWKISHVAQNEFAIMDANSLKMVTQRDGKLSLNVLDRQSHPKLSDAFLGTRIKNDLSEFDAIQWISKPAPQSFAELRTWKTSGIPMPSCETRLEDVDQNNQLGIVDLGPDAKNRLALFKLQKEGLFFAGVDLRSGESFSFQTKSNTQPSALSAPTWTRVEEIAAKSCLGSSCHGSPSATQLSKESDWKEKKPGIQNQLKSKSMPPVGSIQSRELSQEARDLMIRYLEGI
jgi:hypothetical protein